MGYLLGVDVGSSSTKVGLIDLDGHAVAVSSRSYPTEQPKPGFKEQNPELWWEAVVSAIREATKDADTRRLLAIGSTGHICSHTFVDAAGKVIRPALGFQDQRAVTEVEELLSKTTREELAVELGVDLPPAAIWPLPRLLWFRKMEPATLERARYLIQAKDFINFRLTGEFASDFSTNRGLVNLSNGLPAKKVLKKLGLREDLLPHLYGPEQVMGRVSAQAAVETGLPQGLPVVTGWNDLNASVLGSGAVNVGDAFDITGTSEHVGVVTSTKHAVLGLICAPFLPGKYLFYGVTSNGGGALSWYQRGFGLQFEELLRLAEKTAMGCDNLLFLPYLDGERSPIWDPRACGAFVGIRNHHQQGHFVRAILEGVAFGLLQILDLIEDEIGAITSPIIVSGGAARLRLWNQIKTDIWGRRTTVPEYVHAAVVGAAMLATVGTGNYATCEAAAGAMFRMKEEFSVATDHHDSYQRLNAQFRKIYPALRQIFTELYEEHCQEEETTCPQKPL
jgi:sugar (pentulose or hexulose) kinase